MSAIHLCIDIQKGHPLAYPDLIGCWDNLKANISLLGQQLSQRGIKTVYVALEGGLVPFEEGVGLFKDTPAFTKQRLDEDARLLIDFPLSPNSLVAYKTTYSVHAESAIADYIFRNGYKKIILSGVAERVSTLFPEVHFCVTETAIDFRRAGYEVVIAADATDEGTLLEDRLSLEHRKKFHRRWGVKVNPISKIISDIDKANRPFGMRVFGFLKTMGR